MTNEMMARTPREALAKGETRYFTGRPCRKGHVAQRRVSDTHCVKCANDKAQLWKAENRLRFAAYMKNNHLQKTYGLTTGRLNEMIAAQDFRCAICNELFGDGPRDVCVDHDHDNKIIRSLLCGHCNKGLGYFKDRIESLMAASEYLKRWGK